MKAREFSLAKHHLGLSEQEDSLVPVVFMGTNMSFRVKKRSASIFGEPSAARKFGG